MDWLTISANGLGIDNWLTGGITAPCNALLRIHGFSCSFQDVSEFDDYPLAAVELTAMKMVMRAQQDVTDKNIEDSFSGLGSLELQRKNQIKLRWSQGRKRSLSRAILYVSVFEDYFRPTFCRGPFLRRGFGDQMSANKGRKIIYYAILSDDWKERRVIKMKMA